MLPHLLFDNLMLIQLLNDHLLSAFLSPLCLKSVLTSRWALQGYSLLRFEGETLHDLELATFFAQIKLVVRLQQQCVIVSAFLLD